MTATYTASRQHILFGTDKIMFGLFNGSGSGKIAKVYRLWVRNIQCTAVTGVPIVFNVLTISAASGGIPAQINRMSLNSSTAPAQLVVGEDLTVTEVASFRRFPWSTDEPQINVGTIDELQLQRPTVTMIDFNFNDSVIQPLVLREGEGICIKNITSIVINAYCNISIEFTLE